VTATTTSDVRNCARCGGQHLQLEFRRFTRPFGVGREAFQWWAPCPTNGEPLLMRRVEAPDVASYHRSA